MNHIPLLEDCTFYTRSTSPAACSSAGCVSFPTCAPGPTPSPPDDIITRTRDRLAAMANGAGAQ